MFPTAQLYTEDCRWAPVDTLPACRQPEVPAGWGKGQQDNSERQLIFQSSLQDQVEGTLCLRSDLCLVSSVSLSFPTPLPATPGNTSLIHHLHTNPHLRICFWEPSLRPFPRMYLLGWWYVCDLVLCVMYFIRCFLHVCSRRGTDLRFLPGKSAAHPVSLGLSQEEMSLSLCQVGQGGTARAL